MNDKTIIKCIHRQQERCNAYSNVVFTFDCEEFDNCYFKQLARAREEIEKFKDKVKYMEEDIKIVETARNDLEREVKKWEHQAELGSDTTDRLSKELEDKNQEIEDLKMQLMQKSEVDTFFSTPIEGWDNDPCKICQYKQDYQAKKQKCEEYKHVLDSLEQFFKENNQTIEIVKNIVMKYGELYFKEKFEKEIFDFFHKAEE